MHIARKVSVRTNLTLAILVTVALSWVIGSGVANYFSYLNFRAFRMHMMEESGLPPDAFPAPRFGIAEFFTGRPPLPDVPRGRGRGRPYPPPGTPGQWQPPGPPPPPYRLGPMQDGFMRGMTLRALVALGLAALAGAWLGRKFTRPLSELSAGAKAFQSADFSYRIPSGGGNEFDEVAASMNEMAERVSDQIGTLEKDAQRRRQLLADLAHELRSPVATIETMAGAMRDGITDSADRKQFAIDAMVSSSRQLGRLVVDLMELAKLDLMELPMHLADADILEIARSVVRSHESAAAQAGISLKVTSGQSVMACVDSGRIAQILNNIIENAISYAGAGAEVKVAVTDSEPVEITVADTGRGISEADLGFVTDPFYRTDDVRSPEEGHSGLGLSIASRLAEAHGGELTVSSTFGEGTTVRIIIPRHSHHRPGQLA